MVWQGWLGQNSLTQRILFFVLLPVGIHNMSIFIYQTRLIFHRRNSRKGPMLPYEWILIITLFFGSLYTIIYYTRFLSHATSDAACRIIMSSIVFTLFLFKFMFDLFVLERLFLIAKFSRIVLVLSRIALLSLVTISATVNWIRNDAYYDDSIQLCQYNAPIQAKVAYFVIESMIVTIFAMTFARKLNGMGFENDAKYLVKKYMILSVVGIVTSQFAYVMSMIVGVSALFMALDIAINCWCMLLTFQDNKLLYDKICGPLDHCVGDKCISCCTCNCCLSEMNHSSDGTEVSDIDAGKDKAKPKGSEGVIVHNTPSVILYISTTYTESTSDPNIGAKPRLVKIPSITTSSR
eukprot:666618_1